MNTQNNLVQTIHLGIIGFGEVGGIFGAGLARTIPSAGASQPPASGGDAPGSPKISRIAAWDIQLENPANAPRFQSRAKDCAVELAANLAALCAGANLLISAVTAANTVAVAAAAAAHIKPGSIFLDLNSASPQAKKQAAALIEAAGGSYVEAGVMTSVPPYGIGVPMLLGGAAAASLAETLNALGMNTRAVASELGVAGAIKMCRSVMIKGLEALVIESYTTARAYGVEDFVLPTLQETFPSIDWSRQGSYFFSRVVQHGKRRAEEMREVANTVQEAGFEPLMSAAIAAKQDWVAQLAAAGLFADLKDASWQDYADRLISHAHDKPA